MSSWRAQYFVVTRSKVCGGTHETSYKISDKTIRERWAIRFGLAPRTCAPWGCIVRVVSLTKPTRIPTRTIPPLCSLACPLSPPLRVLPVSSARWMLWPTWRRNIKHNTEWRLAQDVAGALDALADLAAQHRPERWLAPRVLRLQQQCRVQPCPGPSSIGSEPLPHFGGVKGRGCAAALASPLTWLSCTTSSWIMLDAWQRNATQQKTS